LLEIDLFDHYQLNSTSNYIERGLFKASFWSNNIWDFGGYEIVKKIAFRGSKGNFDQFEILSSNFTDRILMSSLTFLAEFKICPSLVSS
jgi:hypothetical protein